MKFPESSYELLVIILMAGVPYQKEVKVFQSYLVAGKNPSFTFDC
jgi:hypothetical protein